MKGFTLLEVLISVVVLTLLMSALYGVYNSSADSVLIAKEGGEIRQTARLILERMSVELESALAGDGYSLVGEDAEVNGRPADRIAFACAGNGSAEIGADLFLVSYGLSQSELKNDLILVRNEAALIGLGLSTGAHSYELARMVRGLDFVYYDEQGREWKDWNSMTGTRVNRLPSFIRISLTLRGPSEQEQTFTTGVHPELSGGSSR